MLDHRPVRPARASVQAGDCTDAHGAACRSKATSSPRSIYLVFCFSMSRYSDVSRAQAAHRTQDADGSRGPAMTAKPPPASWPSPTDVDDRDRRRAQVVRRVPRPEGHQPDVYEGRAHRHLRPVRLRQVDADPLHQPARGASERQDHRRRHRADSNDLKNIEQMRREVGMVFQHFNLFPHLTVLENLHAGADLGAQACRRRRPRRRR